MLRRTLQLSVRHGRVACGARRGVCGKMDRSKLVLGLESTCDDTGVALLSVDGEVRGEALVTQNSSSMGGVIPSMSMAWHAQNYPQALNDACLEADVDVERLEEHVEAIAVANRPGLKGGLVIGTDFAKYLSTKHRLPVIPVHHMQAHALMPRMGDQEIEFPFLVLLASGGHCLIAVANDVEEFLLLGTTLDNSPGEMLDKSARILRLHDLRPDLRDLSGGRAVEILASENGDPLAFQFNGTNLYKRDCCLSLSGFKSKFDRLVNELQRTQVYETDELLPRANDLCASLLHSLIILICNRLQRALIFVDQKQMWRDAPVKTIVASGGVLSNQLLREALQEVGNAYDCRVVLPAPKYCTDNGVMIAWNGLEKLRVKSNHWIPYDKVFSDLELFPKFPLGQNITDDVAREKIKIDRKIDLTTIWKS